MVHFKNLAQYIIAALVAASLIGVFLPTAGFAQIEEVLLDQEQLQEETQNTQPESTEDSGLEEGPVVEEESPDEGPAGEDVAPEEAPQEDQQEGQDEGLTQDQGEPAAEQADESTSAIVSTHTELARAVANSSIDTIILANNVALTANIAIPASKPALTIDGQGSYTLEQQGMYTFTSSSAQGAVYTFKDLTILGRSYYGVVWCTATTNAPTIVLNNINYNGPQLIYNRYGTAELYGANTVYLQRNGTLSNDAEEVGEVHGFTVYGSLDLTSTSTGRSFLWMFPVGSEKPYLTIANGASARFSTAKNTGFGFFYVEGTAYPVVLTVEDTARLELAISGYNPLSTNEAHRLDSIHIGKNAYASFEFAGGIALGNSLFVDEGATLLMNYRVSPGTGASAYAYPLFRFLKTSGSAPVITVNNPKLVQFAVEPTNRPIFGLAYANSLSLTTTEVSYWQSYSAAMAEEMPTRTWSSEAPSGFTATVNLRAGQDSLQSITSSDEDFAANFNPAHARVIQMAASEPKWINVRIPVTMLFGTLDSYEEGAIISPLFEIQNDSTIPMQVGLAEFRINDSAGINLLSGSDAPRTSSDLKLDLNVQEGAFIEYLHPQNIGTSSSTALKTLAPSETAYLSFSGTYFGPFQEGITYKPNYSLVWTFTPFT